VHAGRELSGEVQFGGFTSLPDVLGLLLHDLTIEQDYTTMTEVSGSLKRVSKSIGSNWEGSSKVVADVSGLVSSTEFSVRNRLHMLDGLFAVAFW
jgi:hypothetical protein